MVSDRRSVAAKLALLARADELGNVADACRELGYSRDTYYRLRKLYEQHGEAGLQIPSRRRPALSRRVAPEIGAAVLELARREPLWGPILVSRELCGQSLRISAAGVRRVWKRHGLATTEKRLAALAAGDAAAGAEPADVPIVAELRRLRVELAEIKGRLDRRERQTRSYAEKPRRKGAHAHARPAAARGAGFLSALLGFPVPPLATDDAAPLVSGAESVANGEHPRGILSRLFAASPLDVDAADVAAAGVDRPDVDATPVLPP